MRKKQKEYLIIDAYNVINNWPELIEIRDNLEHARDKLIGLMLEYGAYKGYQVFVVFDAPYTAEKENIQQLSSFLTVIFTQEDETADSYIEKLAYASVRLGKKVYVVTSDWVEQMVILGAGAYRISSRELRKDVRKAKKVMEEEYSINSKLNRNELGGIISSAVADKLEVIRRGKK